MSPSSYIFLSHHSDDKTDVELLAEKLERHPLAKQHNIKVWLDKNNLKHGEQYTHQFAEAIGSSDTCAFLVFMPSESVRAYVEYEIGVAFDRQMSNKNQGKHFPILPVYPGIASERSPLPEIIKTYNYRENIATDSSEITDILNDVIKAIFTRLTVSKVSVKNQTLALPISEQWLCFDLKREGDMVIATSADDSEITAQMSVKEFFLNIPSGTAPYKSEVQDFYLQAPSGTLRHQLFSVAFPRMGESPKRLRIRTDDKDLATVPWELLHSKTTVEVGSVSSNYRPGLTTRNLANPLVGIPAKARGINGTPHYRDIHEVFNRDLDIRGPIPRVTSKQSLIRELHFQKPDCLYIYAGYDGKQLFFDPPAIQMDKEDNTFTLDELGMLLAQVGMKPIVFLCLIGEELDKYPKTLVENCRLLWLQSTSSPAIQIHSSLENIFLSVLSQMDDKEDLVSLIYTANPSRRNVKKHLWVNGQSPNIVCKGSPLIDRLRASLLRVMLGREDLKGRLYSETRLPENFNRSRCLAYVVTGNEAACPFDVPAQLEQRFYNDNDDNSLPILSFPLAVDVDNDSDARDVIGELFNVSLADGRGDIDETFSKELRDRGYLGQDCCIALNWYFNLPESASSEFQVWLEFWADMVLDVIVEFVPERTIILNAICIQVEDENRAQEFQEMANELLEKHWDNGIKLIFIDDALGKLKSREVLNFFRVNADWQEALKLKENKIDLKHYTDWIYQRSNQGEFEKTVNLIWQQYQSDYNDYQVEEVHS